MLSEAISGATTAFVDPSKVTAAQKLHSFIKDVVFAFFYKSQRLCHGRRTGGYRWLEQVLLVWLMAQLISLASNPFLPWVRTVSTLAFCFYGMLDDTHHMDTHAYISLFMPCAYRYTGVLTEDFFGCCCCCRIQSFHTSLKLCGSPRASFPSCILPTSAC